jgi:flagella basal body P-ring formation protein FlgA
MKPRSILVVLLILAVASPSFAVTIVQLRSSEQVKVSTGTVTLGEIAVISSDSKDAETKLRDLRIALAPPPGQSRVIDVDLVRIAVRTVGFDPDFIGLRDASDVTIVTAANQVTGQQLLEMARNVVYERLSYPPESITIEHNNLPPDFFVPAGALTITPEPPPNEDFIGLSFLPFAVAVDGKLCRRVSLNITVRVNALVAVANRSIRRGETLSAADFRLVDRDLSTQPTGAITKPETVIGKRAKVAIAGDQVICERMVEEPPLIKVQDTILIQVVCGDVVISAPGIALQDGRLGDEIRVVSSLGRKTITGTVVDKGAVMVVIPGGARQ